MLRGQQCPTADIRAPLYLDKDAGSGYLQAWTRTHAWSRPHACPVIPLLQVPVPVCVTAPAPAIVPPTVCVPAAACVSAACVPAAHKLLTARLQWGREGASTCKIPTASHSDVHHGLAAAWVRLLLCRAWAAGLLQVTCSAMDQICRCAGTETAHDVS